MVPPASASNYSECFIHNEQLQHKVLRTPPFPIQNSLLSSSRYIQAGRKSEPCFLTSCRQGGRDSFLPPFHYSRFLQNVEERRLQVAVCLLFLKDVPG